MKTLRCLLAGLAFSLSSAPAQTMGPDFAADYHAVFLGSVPGVPANYGGLVFSREDPDVLLIAGTSGGAEGAVYAVRVIRNSQGAIQGFSGSATRLATAPFIDGGLAYGPDGILFFTAYPDNTLGQIRSGSTTPDRVTELTPLGVEGSVGAVGLVPAGFAGAGRLKVVSYESNRFFDLPLTVQPDGTYLPGSAVAAADSLAGGTEGFVYLKGGTGQNPRFAADSMLIAEYVSGQVAAYEIDGDGNPRLDRRRVFVANMGGAPAGVALDPIAGDVLIAPFGGAQQLLRVSRLGRLSAAAFAGTGHYYEAVRAPSGITRSAAATAAAAAGGYLASILSAAENAFVYSLIDATYFGDVSDVGLRLGPWLGGLNAGFGWAWGSGEPFTYTNWSPGQPDGFGGGSQYLLFGEGGTWGDHPGNQLAGYPLPKGFIIEYDRDPRGDIPLSEAVAAVPVVAGDGVSVEIFNGLGGGVAPTPAALEGRAPDGLTLSPVVDFPHPGLVINVGNNFDTFFADTTVPPAQVSGLSALNFTLRLSGLLRITRDLDRNPVTSVIDIDLGVGSDDGFHLTVGSKVLGSAGDRGFSFTWMPVTFEDEGLYPFTLLYAANAVGQSGLEFAWRTGSPVAEALIPQDALYTSATVADRLITFEEVPAGAVVSEQYVAQGVRFVTSAGLRVTDAVADFVPVSGNRVLGDPASPPAGPGTVEIQFVDPVAAIPAVTNFASLYVIDAEGVGATAKAYNPGGAEIFSRTVNDGGRTQTLVEIDRPLIAKLVVTLGSGAEKSAIDNVAFRAPAVARPRLALALDAPTVTEGASVAGTVTLAEPWYADLLVSLTSPFPNQLEAGPPVLIPAGQTSAAVSFTARQDFAIEAPLPVVVTATAPGAFTAQAPVTVLDDDWPVLALTLDRGTVAETAGANAVLATLTRDPVNGQPLTVTLSSSLPATVLAPATVTIPADTATVTFPLSLVDDSAATGPRTAQLRAEVQVAGAGVISESTASLVVTDNEGPRLELTFAQGWVMEGGNATATVTRADAPLVSALPVTLSAAVADKLAFPATVTIPAQAASANFTLSGVANDVAAGSVLVRLGAAAAGFSPGETTVVVTDVARPDLVVKNVAAPVSVETEAFFTVSYRLENNGPAAAIGPFTQRLLLSTDPVPGHDTLLGQSDFTGTLAAGVGFDRTETVRAPRAAGTYWVLIATDAAEQVPELLETNNIAVAAGPITVGAAYTATVQTAAGLVPANTPITFTGSATKPGGAKVPHVLVNLHLRTAGTERIIAALTNSAGDFSTTWQPLPGEGGDYEVGASHPGVANAPTQDTFAILTVRTVFPEGVLAFDEGGSASFTGTLVNPTAYPLTGLTLVAVDAPAGLTPQITLPGTSLTAGQTLEAGVALTGAAGFSGRHTLTLRLTTNQGVTLTVPVTVEVTPLRPVLALTPDALSASVRRGEQKSVSFTLANTGGAATGAVEVVAPAVPWIHLASPAVLESIAPGGSAAVTLVLAPDDTQALTAYQGQLVLRPATGAEWLVPFEFRVVSSLVGGLEIDVVDEAFFFTAAAPKVSGATVTLRDVFSAEALASMTTGAAGRAAFPTLTEGWYAVEVESPVHPRWKGNVFVNAGAPTFKQIFVSRDWVTYSWTVEEIELEDRYRISVESTFETNVPAPVLTITPAVLDVEDLTVLGQTKVVNFTIENHGLINADDGRLAFGTHPFYQVTPLIEDFGTLSAKSSITIPVIVKRIGEFAEDGSVRPLSARSAAGGRTTRDGGGGGVPCGFSGVLSWSYICETDVNKATGIAVSGVIGDCGGGPGGWWIPPGGPIGGGGGSFHGVTIIAGQSDCLTDCYTNAAIDCGMGFIPGWGCGWGVGRCIASGGDYFTCVSAAAGCLGGPVTNGILCAASFMKCYMEAAQGSSGGGGRSTRSAHAEEFELGEPWLMLMDAPTRAYDPALGAALGRLETALDLQTVVLGARERVLALADANVTAWHQALSGFGHADSEQGTYLSAGEISQLQTLAQSLGLEFAPLRLVIDRLNRTQDYAARGITSLDAVPAGESTDFIPRDVLQLAAFAVIQAADESQALGYLDPGDELARRFTATRARLERGGGGVCAQVKLKIDQDLVMTRSAFRGTLELTNNQPGVTLTEVGFDLDLRDAAGQDAVDHFNIRVTQLTGLAAIDGTGQLGPHATGSAQWTLIPRDTAAPLADTPYTIGGTIHYRQGGVLFSIPVTPVVITVKPDAALYLRYFHQRDVFSDDPHTDPIEPAIPYALAVLVENRGAGAARNLSITSAQPEIVDNEKGLLIDFQIIGTEVAGQPLSPSLQAGFGTLAPGERKVATWWLTSTLQGLFLNYSATFEHLDGLGDERISLLKHVEIHELIHLIEAQGALADGLPDFLVNDVPDIDDLPDTVHLSDGSIAPVTVHQTASVSGPVTPASLSVTLTASVGGGWIYLRVPDPGDGAFRLVSAVRSDGRELPLDKNVWATDRTFVGLGQQPIYENILHLADHDSPGTYTLTYVLVAAPDVTPPSSQVVTLPAHSGPLIPVRWSGTDDQGIATYDLFVQVNGGVWQPWLTGTPRTSAIYEGVLGQSYAFYSRATDRVGNVENQAVAADTSTQVTLTNSPPDIASIPAQTIDEGGVFTYQVVATDPDGPDEALGYAVTAGRAGFTIDATGLLRWTAGTADGGQVINVTVTVTDNGFPAAVAQRTFALTVRDVNHPPVVQSVPPQTIVANGSLALDIRATDPDLPAQTLTYTLGSGAPAGLVLHPVSGRLTWAPGAAEAGNAYGVTVLVTDNGTPPASAAVAFPVTVLEGLWLDHPPVIAPVPALLAVKGTTARWDFTATDADGEPVTLSVDFTGLPGLPSFSTTLGGGAGVFNWSTTPVPPGTYGFVLHATSGLQEVSQPITVRIVEDTPYWRWAATVLTGAASLGDVPPFADADGDGRINLFEMALALDPLHADTTATPLRIGVPTTSPATVFPLEISFLRTTGSAALVDFHLEYSSTLGGPWQPWPGTAALTAAPVPGNATLEQATFTLSPPAGGVPTPARAFFRLALTARE